jgi:hypothetical protein
VANSQRISADFIEMISPGLLERISGSIASILVDINNGLVSVAGEAVQAGSTGRKTRRLVAMDGR